jgi:hypothetical protein
LKSLMAAVVVICLGLGGWHLLWTKGQCVEPGPAVVGQPIKIHGRFVRIFAGDESGRYYLSVSPIDEPGFGGRCFGLGWYGEAEYVGWWMYEFEGNLSPLDVGEFTMTLTPEGGSPIRGSIVVRGAE